jgi:hypothetical protein
MTASHKPPVDPPRKDIARALIDLVLRPRTTLWPAWSWKAAAVSALFRATTFFVTNLRAGKHEAFHAMMIEAIFAIFAAGLLGAVSQQLRNARPFWATALIVWLLMPALMTLTQFGVHHLAGTPHLGTGLIASFLFAAIASSFSWYAMAHGALLGGDDSTTLRHDIRALPPIILGYILAVPRMLFSKQHNP